MQRKSRDPDSALRSERLGLTAPEVLVILALVVVLLLLVAATLPRQREGSRAAVCRDNLRRIGAALAIVDMRTGHLPQVPRLGSEGERDAPSPLRTLLEELGQPDLTGVTDPEHPPAKQPGVRLVERPLPGVVCPSDRNPLAGRFPAPISYRATTGSCPDGRDGAFAPGRQTSLAEVEQADGLAFTAAFSERLVGNSRPTADPANYLRVDASLDESESCPPSPPGAWQGDAGSSWFTADWRSTLYNHVLPPDRSPSCAASDRRTALMGASSGHLTGVHVLILDGSVRTYRPTVDLKIWRDLATTGGAAAVSSK